MTMTLTPADKHPGARIRLWPGIAAAAIQWLLRLGVPAVSPENGILGLLAAIAFSVVILVWWLFFSRAPWAERIAAIVLMIAAAGITYPFLHPSISTGMMNRMFWLHISPALTLALVAWAVLSRNLSGPARYVTMAIAILMGGGIFAALRTDGVTGDGMAQLTWRWAKDPEQRLLASAPSDPPRSEPAKEVPVEAAVLKPAPAAIPSPAKPEVAPVIPGVAEWPGFRGPNRDGVVTGVRIHTGWSASRPAELWRRKVGPGWSSIAVAGNFFYTQEQRGEFEVVVCHQLATGEPVWVHRDKARFWESNAGAGPRGTPTIHNGRVYTFGGTGILNALDAATGAPVWTRNAAKEIGVATPGWGFTSSPLVVDDALIVAVSGRVAAYDLATGKPRWTGPKIGGSYSSPHLFTLAGVPQVVMLSGNGATSFSPADGKILWQHAWEGATILQPTLAGEDSLLISTSDMMGSLGIRRLAIAKGPDGWTAKEVWTSPGLKPYFNDLVVHNGFAYGFDGSILSCIDLNDGKRKWKGGRYGHGQMLLLKDQDALLILSEEGEVALVGATPEGFTELARMPAIEGKTWNHPVVARDVLLVRNGEEMVAFRLPVAGS